MGTGLESGHVNGFDQERRQFVHVTPVRLRGWERRYHQAIEYELSRPFNWVTNNCGHLMGAAIRSCHGEHPVLDNLIGLDSEEAVRALVQDKGGLRKILVEHFEPIPKSLAQQADVGCFVGSLNGVEVEVGCVILDGQAVAKMPGRSKFYMNISQLTVVFRV